MKIAVRGGHNRTVTGASGIVDEVTEDRNIYPHVIAYLKLDGNDVIDVTPDRTNTSGEDLSYGISRANAFGADFGCSIHLNASTGNGHGTEVLHYPNSTAGKAFASKISAGIASLGFTNRGAVADTRNLYEPKYSKMPWNIVECFFCDSPSDVSLYKSIGPEAIGKAIAEAIVGHVINAKPTVPSDFDELTYLLVPENRDVLKEALGDRIHFATTHWLNWGFNEHRQYK